MPGAKITLPDNIAIRCHFSAEKWDSSQRLNWLWENEKWGRYYSVKAENYVHWNNDKIYIYNSGSKNSFCNGCLTPMRLEIYASTGHYYVCPGRPIIEDIQT